MLLALVNCVRNMQRHGNMTEQGLAGVGVGVGVGVMRPCNRKYKTRGTWSFSLT